MDIEHLHIMARDRSISLGCAVQIEDADGRYTIAYMASPENRDDLIRRAKALGKKCRIFVPKSV